MFFLIIFFDIVFFILLKVYKKIEPEIKTIYSKYLIYIFLLGSISIFLYTADNFIFHNQVDMEGDAQMYYYGAEEYLTTGQTSAFYPYYVKFISLFLWKGNVITIRYAHLFLFLLIFAIGTLILNNFKVSRKGYEYFSFFVGLSGVYYAFVSEIVRDLFILFHLVVVVYLISKLLLLYDQGNLRLRKVIIYLTLLLFVVSGINELANFIVYILLAALWCVLIIRIALSKINFFYKTIILVFVTLISFIVIMFVSPIESFIYQYQLNIIEKTRIQEEMGYTGGRGIEKNLLFASLRFIFGPGLIRPLFPSQYTLVYTTMFMVFTWWAALFWYLNLLITIPLIIKRPLIFLKNTTALFLLVLIVEYILVYALSVGGLGGLRKRMIVHFMYTLFIAINYFSNFQPRKVKDFKFYYKGIKLPSTVTVGITILLFILIHLRGLD